VSSRYVPGRGHWIFGPSRKTSVASIISDPLELARGPIREFSARCVQSAGAMLSRRSEARPLIRRGQARVCDTASITRAYGSYLLLRAGLMSQDVDDSTYFGLLSRSPPTNSPRKPRH
jgi:hypothetical protein